MASNVDDKNSLFPMSPIHLFGSADNEDTSALVEAYKVVLVVEMAIYVFAILIAVLIDCDRPESSYPGKLTIKAIASAVCGLIISIVTVAAGTGIGALFGGMGGVIFGIFLGCVGSIAGSVITFISM